MVIKHQTHVPLNVKVINILLYKLVPGVLAKMIGAKLFNMDQQLVLLMEVVGLIMSIKIIE